MVGVGTALADDPLLTVRLPGVDLKPLRVVLDTHLRLPARSRLAATARECSDPRHRRARTRRTRRRGASPTSASTIERVGLDAGGHVDLVQALACARGGAGSPASSAKAARASPPG